jgi:hypothetical protein
VKIYLSGGIEFSIFSKPQTNMSKGTIISAAGLFFVLNLRTKDELNGLVTSTRTVFDARSSKYAEFPSRVILIIGHLFSDDCTLSIIEATSTTFVPL